MLRSRNLIMLAVLVAGVVLVLSVEWERIVGPEAELPAPEASQVVIGRSYRVDESYVRRTGKVPAVGFQLILPKRATDSHKITVEEAPEGGIVQFNFHAADDTFLESLFIAPIRIPEGDMQARLDEIAPRLAAQAPALLGRKFEEVTAEPVRVVTVGRYRAVELTGTYRDPRDDARYSYRFLALPDPDRPQSLYAVSHVNQAHRKPGNADEFAGTLSGLALSTLRLSAAPDGPAGASAAPASAAPAAPAE